MNGITIAIMAVLRDLYVLQSEPRRPTRAEAVERIGRLGSELATTGAPREATDFLFRLQLLLLHPGATQAELDALTPAGAAE